MWYLYYEKIINDVLYFLEYIRVSKWCINYKVLLEYSYGCLDNYFCILIVELNIYYRGKMIYEV